jgi:hypothetical protein
MYSKEEKMEIANNIMRQLGTNHNKLSIMIGAKHFVLTDSGVAFKFKSNRGINYIKIQLNSKDLYDVTYKSVRGTKTNITKNISQDLYADMLKSDIENTIGLYLSL